MVADVLGHGTPSDVDPDTAFSDLGFDSLAAIELRNKLTGATGLTTGVAVVFDHPTVTKMSAWLVERLGFADAPPPDGGDADIRARIAAIPIATLRRSGMLDALLRLGSAPDASSAADSQDVAIDEMDSDELIRHVLANRRRPAGDPS